MIKVRFAPSPTGDLHLGSARTAVFNWLYARHHQGKFILRIEDTDKIRSKPKYTKSIIKDMEWLGLNYDEIYYQSQRYDIYRKYLDKLLSEGHAYYCTETREKMLERYKKQGIKNIYQYDGRERGNTQKPPEGTTYSIRVNIGESRDIVFPDLIKKEVTINSIELDDFVIWKTDGSPTYQFAVVIDDALMGITHVFRGEDHLTNTAKQLILYSLLGFTPPVFAHLPMVLDIDRSPLSKRKGSTNIATYRKLGCLPDALINYISRLGWGYQNKEIFSIEELIRVFGEGHFNKTNSVYDEEKLAWVNGQHIKLLDTDRLLSHFQLYREENNLELVGRMKNQQWLHNAIALLKDRHRTLLELYKEISFFAVETKTLEASAREKKLSFLEKPQNKKAFEVTVAYLKSLNGIDDEVEPRLREIAKEQGAKFGVLAQLLRISLTGQLTSPDIITVMKLLGTEGLKKQLSKEKQ